MEGELRDVTVIADESALKFDEVAFNHYINHPILNNIPVGYYLNGVKMIMFFFIYFLLI